MSNQRLPKNKSVLLRVDLNLPFKKGEFADLSRLVAIGPTLNQLLKNNCKVALISHLGRPDPDNFEERFSLKNVAKAIEQMFKIGCEFTEIDKTSIANILTKLDSTRVLLLENTRKYKGEKQDDQSLLKT